MQVKSEVFSRFGSLVDFSSGEPLVGVGAPTVGADLCVRPSLPERSLFCGQTRRSAPTQATSARQFHSSNAVTLMCRHSRASLHHRYQSRASVAERPGRCSLNAVKLNGNGRIVAPSRRSTGSNDWRLGVTHYIYSALIDALLVAHQ